MTKRLPDVTLEDIFKSSPTILYHVKENKVVWISDNCVNVLGVDPGQLCIDFSSWQERVLPEHREQFNPVYKPGNTWHEYQFKRDDGTYCWICDRRNCLGENGSLSIHGSLTVIDDRKNKEDVLVHEHRLHISGPTMVFQWKNSDGWPVEYVSPNIEEYTGYRPEDLYQNEPGYSDLVHPQDIDRVVNEVTMALECNSEIFEHLPYRIVTKTGDTLWVSDFTTVIKNAQGDITHFLGHVLDITAQRRVEEELQKEKDRLDLVIEGTNIGIWGWNIQTGNTVFNERWADIIGYTLDELKPTSINTWVEHTHPEDLEQSNKLIQEHLEGKSDFYESECRMKHRDGSWRWILDRGKVVEWMDDGKPLRMTGTHADITSRKKTEIQQEQEQALLRAILQTSLDGYLLLNLGGKIFETNKAYCDMLGYSSDELIGMSLHDIEAQESLEETEYHFEKIMNEGRDRFVTKHIRSDGVHVDVEVSVITINYNDDIYLASFIRDITGKLKTERELVENNLKLEAFFRQSLDGFFFMMMDEPVDWKNSTDREGLLDFIFKHQSITKINQAMLDQYGAEENDFLGLTPEDFFEHDRDHGKEVWKKLLDQGKLHVETDERRFDGSKMWVEGDYVCLYDLDDRFTGHFGIQRDVTKEKMAYEKLKEIFIMDPLTSCYNRRHIFDRMEEALGRYNRTQEPFAIAVCDIDFFKKINDTHGHLAGDEVLKGFVEMLSHEIRPYDLLGRYGGEEFIILYQGLSLENAAQITERIRVKVQDAPVVYNGQSISFTFSAGLSAPDECESSPVEINELVEKADNRLYEAKEGGRNRIVWQGRNAC